MTWEDEFERLLDKEYKFYGVDGNCFKLGSNVYEAIEDPDDGYRSYLGCIQVREPSGLVFFKRPLALVRVEKIREHNLSGYRLVDVEDDFVWLEVGTDAYDDYYPIFMFAYKVKDEEQ